MSCSDFQSKLDLYIDGEMPSEDMCLADRHLAGCTVCEALVTRHQRLHAFLVTAATDRVAAVDVSGLWDDIEHRLADGVAPFSRKPATLPLSDRVVGWMGAVLGDMSFSPARFGAFAAAAAAAVVFLVSLSSNDATELGSRGEVRVATAPLPASTVRVRPVRIDSMEIGEGHTVSTWMRPKTRTRVFWVAAADEYTDGFAVEPASASLDR